MKMFNYGKRSWGMVFLGYSTQINLRHVFKMSAFGTVRASAASRAPPLAGLPRRAPPSSLLLGFRRVMDYGFLPARRRPQGLVVIGVCLCVCAHCFVRKISQERVHGSPPNLVDGTRGWTSRTSLILVLIGFRMRIQDHFSLSVKLAG